MKYFYAKSCPLELVRTQYINQTFARHNHAGHYVISVVLRGRAELEKDGHLWNYSAGEWFYILPLNPHSLRLDRESEMLSLCIGTEMTERYTRQQTDRLIAAFLEEICKGGMLTGKERDSLLQALSFLLENIGENGDKGSDRGKESSRAKGNGTGRENSHSKEEFSVLVEQIAGTPEYDLTVAGMAQAYFMSKYHFIRQFESYAGLSPHRFQIQSRVRKAQALLRAGAPPVEVALHLGFYDQSHFNRCFRSIVGVPPMEYIASGREISSSQN